jgi:signal transduction histidine kinase
MSQTNDTPPQPTCSEKNGLQGIPGELTALADHVGRHRDTMVRAWQRAIQRDPKLTEGESLPAADLIDHIPAMLASFERSLRAVATEGAVATQVSGQKPAAAHGLQRWRQGYDLREVTRELGKLNECVVLELNRYAKAESSFSLDALTRAQQIWTALCSTTIEESVSQYFVLQQQEAAGHVKDLESALEQIRELEQQRGEVWQQAAHDLRGNLGVAANVTIGLTRHGRNDASRADFVRILVRNLASLHHLLNDVTSLARLQAGRETRQIEPLDLTPIFQSLCEGIRPIAAQRGLYLKCAGPADFAADGDAVKIRRIAQNLILNAAKYTNHGGITVSWGNSRADDPKRWVLDVTDTGPGFHTDSGKPLAAALDKHKSAPSQETTPGERDAASILGSLSVGGTEPRSMRGEPGEGIGLSIVKRLCEMLDATIEMQSVAGSGTSFRIFFPRHYSN